VYYKSYLELIKHQRACLQSPVSFLKEFVPFLHYTMKLKAAQKKMQEMTKEILANRQNRNLKENEKIFLIDMMLKADPPLGEKELTTNTFLFFLAGHETTASALSWAFYLLARHPDTQAKIQEEVDRILGGKHVEPHQLKDLVYLDMFVKEVLRYGSPASTLVTRIAQSDTYLGKYLIPKGTPVGIAIHAIHHNPEFWPNPYDFDPERFDPNKIGKQHPFAFLPFSLGKRVCIGNNFSLMEQKIFLSMTLQKYSVAKIDHPKPLELDPVSLASSPAEVRITLVKREFV